MLSFLIINNSQADSINAKRTNIANQPYPRVARVNRECKMYICSDRLQYFSTQYQHSNEIS